MPCLVLVAGGIGCGKTTFISHLFQNEVQFSELQSSIIKLAPKSRDGDRVNHSIFLYKIHFDELCSLEEQKQMMLSLQGWRNFRVDLLMAVERCVSEAFFCENCISGPLTKRSLELLEKLSYLQFDHCKNLENAVIIVEDNFYYRSMRYDWFQLARRANFGFGTIFVKCPVDIAVARNASRGFEIPEARVEKMFSFIEYPEPSKYKWEKFSIVIDSCNEITEQTVRDTFKFIVEAMRHPAELVLFEQKFEAQTIGSKNVIHQADRILRKILSRRINEMKNSVPEKTLKCVAAQLVDIRHKILMDIKKGDVHLPEELVEKIQNSGIDSIMEAYEDCLDNLFTVILQEESLQIFDSAS